jgi:long-chain acyl-CoA synthetase
MLLRQAIQAKLDRYRETGNNDHPFWDRVVFRKVRNSICWPYQSVFIYYMQVRALIGGNVVGITSGSAPVSRDVFDLIKIAFGGKVIEGRVLMPANDIGI